MSKSLILSLLLIGGAVAGCSKDKVTVSYAEKKFEAESSLDKQACSFSASTNTFSCNELSSYNFDQLDDIEYSLIKLDSEIQSYLKTTTSKIIDSRVAKKLFAIDSYISMVQTNREIKLQKELDTLSVNSPTYINTNCDSLTKEQAYERIAFVKSCASKLANTNGIDGISKVLDKITEIEAFNQESATNNLTSSTIVYPVLVQSNTTRAVKINASQYTDCKSVENTYFALECTTKWDTISE